MLKTTFLFMFLALSMADITPILLSLCPDLTDPLYEIDFSNTYADPNPFEYGEINTLHIDGVMHANVFAKDFCYEAYLNGKKLDKQCYDRGDIVIAEDEYQFDFRIMPFIPLGSWVIFLKLRTDKNKILGGIQGEYAKVARYPGTFPLLGAGLSPWLGAVASVCISPWGLKAAKARD